MSIWGEGANPAAGGGAGRASPPPSPSASASLININIHHNPRSRPPPQLPSSSLLIFFILVNIKINDTRLADQFGNLPPLPSFLVFVVLPFQDSITVPDATVSAQKHSGRSLPESSPMRTYGCRGGIGWRRQQQQRKQQQH